jgi:hypothetical protein
MSYLDILSERQGYPNTNTYVKALKFDSSPADITIDMDDEGTGNELSGFILEVR